LTVVDSEQKLRALFPVLDQFGPSSRVLEQMVKQGLVVLSDGSPHGDTGGAEMKLEGKAKMLPIHFGEGDRWQGRPSYQAIVERCRKLDIAGATVFQGIECCGASTRIRGSHLLQLSRDAPIQATSSDYRHAGEHPTAYSGTG